MRIELTFAFLFLAPPQVSTVPFGIVNGYTIVENVSINGHGPYRFVLDTGARLHARRLLRPNAPERAEKALRNLYAAQQLAGEITGKDR